MTDKKERKAHIFERSSMDWYAEPEDCTSALLKVETFIGKVLDPACGRGHIVKALIDAGVDAEGTDIAVRKAVDGLIQSALHYQPCDWLGDWPGDISRDASWFDHCVMNPPFFGGKGTEAFIRKALGLFRGKIAVFVDKRFLSGSKRAAGLFKEHPPARVWILTPRPSCPPGEYLEAGNKAGGGTADYVWIVWDKTAPPGDTRLGWLHRGKTNERKTT